MEFLTSVFALWPAIAGALCMLFGAVWLVCKATATPDDDAFLAKLAGYMFLLAPYDRFGTLKWPFQAEAAAKSDTGEGFQERSQARAQGEESSAPVAKPAAPSSDVPTGRLR